MAFSTCHLVAGPAVCICGCCVQRAEQIIVNEQDASLDDLFSIEKITGGPKASQFPITFWHLTLERFIGELLDAGFTLTKLIEPRAVEEARSVDPIRHAKTHRTPVFLAVRLVRGV